MCKNFSELWSWEWSCCDIRYIYIASNLVDIAKFLSKVSVPICSPIIMDLCFAIALYHYINTSYCQTSKFLANLMDVRWHLLIFLICIPLIVSEVEPLTISWESFPFRHFACSYRLPIYCFFFFLWLCRIPLPHTQCINPLSVTHFDYAPVTCF